LIQSTFNIFACHKSTLVSFRKTYFLNRKKQLPTILVFNGEIFLINNGSWNHTVVMPTIDCISYRLVSQKAGEDAYFYFIQYKMAPLSCLMNPAQVGSSFIVMLRKCKMDFNSVLFSIHWRKRVKIWIPCAAQTTAKRWPLVLQESISLDPERRSLSIWPALDISTFLVDTR
jgi:hypothetical protein